LIASAKEMAAHAKRRTEAWRIRGQDSTAGWRNGYPKASRTVPGRLRTALRVQSARRSGLGAGPPQARERRARVSAGDCAGAEGGGQGA